MIDKLPSELSDEACAGSNLVTQHPKTSEGARGGGGKWREVKGIRAGG